MVIRVKLAATLVTMLVVSSVAWAEGLRAGAAKTAITPNVKDAKVYMAGFGNNRVATGVHDDLFARCLSLAVGGNTVVLCSVDLVGLFYDDVLKIREMAKARAPELTHLIVASTHDHEGPDTLGLWGPTSLETGMDENYMEWAAQRVADCAMQAIRSAEEAHVALSRDDHILLALLQSDSRAPYVKDPFLFVMNVEAARDRKPIATLVNWSDHPETLGGKNTEITADYPYWLCRYVEARRGGTAVFFVGSIGGLLSTLGDGVAIEDPETGAVAKDETWRKAELVGDTLGELAVRALRSAEAIDVDSIAIRKAVLFVPLENDWFRFAGALGMFRNRKPLFTRGQPDHSTAEKDLPGRGRVKYAIGHDIQTEVDYLRLLGQGRTVAEIATVPGEIYPELINGGIARFPGADYPDAEFEPSLRDHLKSRYQFVFGLANDELGYIIPKAEWDNQPPWLKNNKERWYGEINSAGPEIAGRVMQALVGLIDRQGD